MPGQGHPYIDGELFTVDGSVKTNCICDGEINPLVNGAQATRAEWDYQSVTAVRLTLHFNRHIQLRSELNANYA